MDVLGGDFISLHQVTAKTSSNLSESSWFIVPKWLPKPALRAPQGPKGGISGSAPNNCHKDEYEKPRLYQSNVTKKTEKTEKPSTKGMFSQGLSNKGMVMGVEKRE